MKPSSSHQGRNYAEQIKISIKRKGRTSYSRDFSMQVERIDPMDYWLKIRGSNTDDLLEKLLYLDMMTYLPETGLVNNGHCHHGHSLEARALFGPPPVEAVAGHSLLFKA